MTAEGAPTPCHRLPRLFPVPSTWPIIRQVGQTTAMVGFLLSVTFSCGVFIAVAHVVNKEFVAPVYDVVANLTAFACAVAASVLLGHLFPAGLAGAAILCWIVLARRTIVDRRTRKRNDG